MHLKIRDKERTKRKGGAIANTDSHRRPPGQGQGQAESLILWQAFAQDVQRYPDGDNRSEAEKQLLEAELALIAKSEAADKSGRQERAEERP